MEDRNPAYPDSDQGCSAAAPDPKPKLYVGTKLILARPMDEATFLASKDPNQIMPDGQVNRSGFEVTYTDGYVSWSPYLAFVKAYRLVTPQEKELFM